MLNTSSLGDRAKDEERAEMIRREEALGRWRSPATRDLSDSVADALVLAEAKLQREAREAPIMSSGPQDSDFASGGSYL